MQLQQLISFGFGSGHSAATTASRATGASGATHSPAHKLLTGTVWAALGQQGQPRGVKDIVSTLRSTLAAGIASGQNVEPRLAKSINTALSQATRQLESQGVDPSHVAKLVSRFRQELSHGLDEAARTAAAASASAGSASAPSSTSVTGSSSSSSNGNSSDSSGSISVVSSNSGTGSPTSASTSGAHFVARESGSLQILTSEGDVVTLSFKEKASGTLPAQSGAGAPSGAGATSDAGTTSAGGATSSASGTVVSRGQVQIAVSGNLNDSELSAINDVLSQVDALATKFFSGDAQGAFAAAASIGTDPTEIAGFSLQLSYSDRVYSPTPHAATPGAATPAAGASGTTGATTPTSGDSTTLPTQPSQTPTDTPPVVTQPVVSSSAPTDSATSTSPTASSDGSAPADSTASATTPAATDTTATADAGSSASSLTPKQAIANFVQEVLAKLGAGSRSSNNGISLRWKLDLLAKALPAYAPSKSVSTTQAASLAVSTLNQLAA